MGQTESADGKRAHAAKEEEKCGFPKVGIAHRLANVSMMDDVSLIWLDKNIDTHRADCRHTLTELQRIVQTINIFTDGDKCIEFVNGIDHNRTCMLIISGTLGQHIVPRLHDLLHIDSIFIFCADKVQHEQWTKRWFKIKGVFTEILPICESLKRTVQETEHSTVSISCVGTTDKMSNKILDQLDPSFMWTQIISEILLTVQFEKQHIDEFIGYCRIKYAENDKELKIIKELEQTYRDKTPIWWYTKECFLYRLVNSALFEMDAVMIIKVGFFICDLHRDIERLHKEQFSSEQIGQSFIVYRGEGLSKKRFEQMSENIGGLLAFDNFVSTSKTRGVAQKFAHSSLSRTDSMGILFVMTIDPSKSTTHFASIRDVSSIKIEDEILFTMRPVFRIGNITSMNRARRLFQVDLTLTSDEDDNLRILSEQIREATLPNERGWYRLGSVLFRMGHYAKAQQVYEVLLEQAINQSERARICCQLGTMTGNQKEYEKALSYYDKCLEIYRKTLPSSDHDFAVVYNNMGIVYYHTGEYERARLFHEKALVIQRQSLFPNDPHLATSLSNLCTVDYKMSKYTEALSQYEEALAIRQKSLSSNHPDLDASYNSID